MRKLILAVLAATVAVPSVATPAMAQTRHDVARERQQYWAAKRDYDRARHYGSSRDIREERRDLNRAEAEFQRAIHERNWRRDQQRYASRHGRGDWNAPFRYQSFRPGGTIGAGYVGQRYWVNQPGRYRLPPARPGQRWVRHYDDLLLVDTRRGRVVDVIRDFRW